MAGIDEFVHELERSYSQAQERTSDPAVYNDHREAAEAGRKLKELEEPHRLAQVWLQLRTDLQEAREDGDLRELIPELEAQLHDLETPLREALAPSDPDDDKDAIVEIRQGVGGDRRRCDQHEQKYSCSHRNILITKETVISAAKRAHVVRPLIGMNFEFRISNDELRESRLADADVVFNILHSKFEIRNSSSSTCPSAQ